ncbi:ribonuclease H-like domain-containing protein [Tanacetum coccineum]
MTPIFSPGSSSTSIYSPGSSTPPRYSPRASTPQSYSPGTLRNAECSNCKHLLEKITVLEETPCIITMTGPDPAAPPTSLSDNYEVSKFIHGSSSGISTSDPTLLTPKEIKVDKIILSWIFTTISYALQKRLVIARPKSAKEAWDFISELVKDNKRSRTLALKTKLRSIQLGDLSMEAYFQKVDSLMTILASLDLPVSDEDVVHYVIAGLPGNYNQVCGYTHYQTTFPDLKTARSLLITKEMRLKSKSLALPVDSSSSSMVLVAESVAPAFPNVVGPAQQAPSTPPGFNTGSLANSGHASVLTQALTTGTLYDPTTGDIYPVIAPSPIPRAFLEKPLVLCHACQLGKHVRLPFVSSDTVFVWVYPLINKPDMLSKFVLFCKYVHTQFKCEIKLFQCDHGDKFDNRTLRKLFAENGIQFWFSCAKTSQQNDKSKHMVRTVNNPQGIKDAVWSCGCEKAPGPDGFTFKFIKWFWDTMGNDFIEMVKRFEVDGTIPKGCNSSFIALVPKIKDPIHIKDYRPISLIGCQYKVVSKALANRLLQVIASVVSKVQTAYIKRRQIIDGPLIVNEILSWAAKKKERFFILKIDFEKAFDSLD